MMGQSSKRRSSHAIRAKRESGYDPPELDGLWACLVGAARLCQRLMRREIAAARFGVAWGDRLFKEPVLLQSDTGATDANTNTKKG